MATTLTFPEWLAEQRNRGDEVAEFAAEAAHLTDLPESGGKAIYEGYFENDQPKQREVFERAWTEFQSSPEPASDDDFEKPTSLR